MPQDAPQRSFPIGTALLLVVAGILYVAMLGTISFSTGIGSASFGEAMASLFATTGLWVALAILLIAAGISGHMPRWVAFGAVLLVPLSGVAAFVAIDMCSRHIKWAVLFPVVLPILIAGYALWARMLSWHAKFPPEPMSVMLWGLVLVLSGAALLAASII